MSKLDIAVVALVLLPAIFGLFKGLVNVAITFLGIWAAFVVAGIFADDLHARIAPSLGDGPLTAALAYAAIFLGVVLLAGLVAWLVTRSLKALDLQWANRLAGGALGLACGLLLASVLVVAWGTVAPSGAAHRDSVLAGPLGAFGQLVVALPSLVGDAPAEDGESGEDAPGTAEGPTAAVGNENAGEAGEDDASGSERAGGR